MKNQQGVHHYIYDHQGERIMKSSLITSTVYLNDQVIDDVNNLDPYTVYVNPFYVVTGFMGGDRVSKHYYMNQQRVATDISINYDPNGNGGAEAQGASPRANAQNLALVDLLKVLRALEQPELDTTALTLPRMESVYPELQPSSTTSTALTENITNRILFWYHPDYLGNVDLVTEKDGYAYEFFVYTPWGEEMHQWNANTFNFSSPYRFNGKELDPETGLAYYGARYYQNKIGVWLSVDPKYMQTLMKYEFSANNPIKFIDADGAKPILPDFQVEPEDPINWELVRMGTWNCFSGGVVIVFSGATIIASDGASIEFGALSGFTFGIGSFGFGLAQVTAGFEGSSEEIPSGIFEGVDIATGGDGSLGQIVDIASKGYPKSLPEKAITAVDIANSTLLNLENSEPTNTAKAPSLPIGSIPFPPQDAERPTNCSCTTPGARACTTGPVAVRTHGARPIALIPRNWTPKTGMHYYGARYHHPKLSVWLTVDKLSTHPNQVDKSPYAYSWNNPIRYSDPNGDCPICPFLVKGLTGAVVDYMLQGAFNYAGGMSLTDAFSSSNIDMSDVALSAAQGALPWSVPGGKYGKEAGAAVADVMFNYAKAVANGEEYSLEQMGQDFLIGFSAQLGSGAAEKFFRKTTGQIKAKGEFS